ncbi:putative gustatory receptor 98b [Episyrphus balteatus]|uniref:putative gustatory receptor 98b n=1 Tax=Episyrphus balteatus TaxID=286459 RepID=UPI0024867FF0|nr:putative gustatory receptor 98b [Episyrphus balteatus]
MVMKFGHLLNATKPYQIIFCICGIAPFPVVTEEALNRRIFSVLFYIYKLFLTAATLFTAYERCRYISIRNSTDNDYLTNGLHFAQFITLTLIHSIMHVIVFFKYNELKRVLFEVIEIEQDTLHISNKMHQFCSRFTFKRQLLCVSGLMLITILLTPLMSIHSYMSDVIPVYQWIISIFSEIAIRCKSVEFCVLVQVFNELLSELFVCINELQKTFINCDEDGNIFTERMILQRRIHVIQNIQSKIWKTVNAFTDYFSLTILCQFVWNGVTITNIIYWVYVKFNEASLLVNLSRMSSLTFLLLDILIPCYLCDVCIQTYGKIIRNIHDFKPNDTDILLKLCLREYSLQLTHQKLIFSCGGYFNINLQCFGEIILAITTYIVILIQFKLQGEKP